MTIQWTLVAGFLYSEIIFIILLLLPIISPRVWKSIFQSWICQTFAVKANLYFNIFIAILVIFFLDSIREVLKYGSSLEAEHIALDADIQLRLKLFRSQRNYYIAGFALFFWLIIRKLVILILSQAAVINEIEIAMKEAQAVTNIAENLGKQMIQQGQRINGAMGNTITTQIETLKFELSELSCLHSTATQELEQTRNELMFVKKKANSISSEYHSLLEEHSALQEKFTQHARGDGDKKDD